MSELGDKLVNALREFVHARRTGQPVRQSVLRRVRVRGKGTFIHTSFTAPLPTRKPKQ